MNNSIQDMRKKRFQYLHRLYEKTRGSNLEFENFSSLGKELGYSDEETNLITDYLRDEGLVKFPAFGQITITHYGVVEVENALANPEQPTQYFPPVNIINIGQMINSQIQQDTNQSVQTMAFTSDDLKSIAKFIEEFKNRLPELQIEKDTQQEAEADLATLEAQLKSSKPKHTILRECLASLRRILENATGQVAATLLLRQLPML
jgi:hypothetical protein